MKDPTKKSPLILPIKNMHCRSCEILVRQSLEKVSGVEKVIVSYKKGQALITVGKTTPTLSALEEAIHTAGYAVGKQEKTSFFSKNKEDYFSLLKGALAVGFIALVLKITGVFTFSFNPQGAITFPLTIMVGLVAGISTCMALVGGIVLGISAKWSELHPEKTSWQKFEPHLLFNAGRLGGFLVFGAILGALGSVFQLSIIMIAVLSFFAGLVMLSVGVSLLDIFPRFQSPFSLPSFLRPTKSVQKVNYSSLATMGAGALTFFLPCGFTQAMQVYAASTGSPAKAALVMFGFALGTIPGLLSLGGVTSIVHGSWKKIFFNATGITVLLFGFLSTVNAVHLMGFSSPMMSGGFGVNAGAKQNTVTTEKPSPVVFPTTQITPAITRQTPTIGATNSTAKTFTVRTSVTQDGYEPYKVTVPPNTEVTWIINSKERFTCANDLVVPFAQKRMQLQPGENIITFISPASGTLPYSCSMGMYRGVFEVNTE